MLSTRPRLACVGSVLGRNENFLTVRLKRIYK